MRKFVAATMMITAAGLTACGKHDTKVYTDSKGNSVAMSNSGDGHMTITGSNGEKVEIGAGSNAKMPSWLPLYSGAKVTASFTGQGKDGDAGMVSFHTSDAPDAVIAFYKAKAAAAGMADTMNMNNNNTLVYIAANEKAKTQLSVSATKGSDGTDAQVNWGAK
ncbi:MAG TPA: hypothetical protein VMF58_07390 [Rhizomicrobium sp.]|nr:hypothetical protein [Rhizomicrobium sp.]